MTINTWPKHLMPTPLTVGQGGSNQNQLHPNLDSSAWTLVTPSASLFTPPSVANLENTSSGLQCNSPPITAEQPKSPSTAPLYCPPSIAGEQPPAMVYQRADSRPFVLSNLVWEDVVNRPIMV